MGQLTLPFVMGSFDWASSGTLVGLPVTAALGAIALIGYLFGHRSRTKLIEQDECRQRELDRAPRIAWQLENIADTLRQDLVAHHSKVAEFKRRIRQAHASGDDKMWETLCAEAESILGPTMELAHQLSHAYDQIRQQSDALETFTQGRTDPLTGVGNGRALEQQLQLLFERRNGLLDNDVVLNTQIAAPHDQADRSGRLAVDQNLALADDRGVGDRRVGDRDARDVEVGRQDRRPADGDDDALDFAARRQLPACSGVSCRRRNSCNRISGGA